MLNGVLLLNGVLALLEGAAYGATALLIVRSQRRRAAGPQGRFIAWWVFASIGLVASGLLNLLGAGGLHPAPAVTLSVLSLLVPLIGIALLLDHILLIARGHARLAILVYASYATFFGVLLGTLLAGRPTGTQVVGARVELAYSDPLWIGFTAGIAAASLLPAIAGGWLWRVAGRMDGADRRRVRLVAASLLLWFLSKPLLAIPQQEGSVPGVLLLRAAGLTSATLAMLAYWRP